MTSMFPPVQSPLVPRRKLFALVSSWVRQELLRHGQGIFCRLTGLALIANLTLVPDRFSPPARTIGRAYIYRFWQMDDAGEWLDLIVAILLWPVVTAVSILWFTTQNGGIVAERFGRSRFRQAGDQLKIAFTNGLLPPWYYVFELYRPGAMKTARGFLTHGETKRGTNRLMVRARGSTSPLGDKEAFAQFCARRELAALPTVLSVHDGRFRGASTLPKTDLFVKPVRGRGGRGAERWDYGPDRLYRNPNGRALSGTKLVHHLRDLSRSQPILVQRRATNHPGINDLSSGALSTIRVISCLDEEAQPEIIGAVLRMAVGANVTVDNVHAGGIAAAIRLQDGRLQQATYAGFDARQDWLDRHPRTDAQITSRMLPMWAEVCDLVKRAHCAFADWVIVGWDVAITGDGPQLVEGNSGPDVDLIQRPLKTAFADTRLGELLALHLDQSEPRWRVSRASKGYPVWDSLLSNRREAAGTQAMSAGADHRR